MIGRPTEEGDMPGMPRTYLYVPADRPELVERAATRGSDALILDLEDGIAREHHEQARSLVIGQHRHLADLGQQVWVRMGPEDLADPTPLLAAGLRRLVVPKVGEAVLNALVATAGSTVEVVGLVETAQGLAQVKQIARHPSVVRLGVGEADLVAELGLRSDLAHDLLAPARFQIVLASAAAGLAAPVAPTSLSLDDPSSVEESTRALAAEGFGARTCIHPAQVTPILSGLAPAEDEVAAAREVLAVFDKARAAGSGAARTSDGTMVDEAIARAARTTLARAGAQPTAPSSRMPSTSSRE